MQLGSNLHDTIRYPLWWLWEKLGRNRETKKIAKGHEAPSRQFATSRAKKLIRVQNMTDEEKREFLRHRRANAPALKNRTDTEILSDYTGPGVYMPELTEEGTTNPEITSILDDLAAYQRATTTSVVKTPEELALKAILKHNKTLQTDLLRTSGRVNLFTVPSNNAIPPKQWDLVKFAYKLSRAAYETTTDPKTEIPELAITTPIIDFSRQPAQIQDGFVGWDPTRQMIVVVFKGTDNLQDFMTDLRGTAYVTGSIVAFNGKSLKIPLNGHRGFIERFMNLSGEVLKAIKLMKDLARASSVDVKKILITGHSLGGALASVCAFILCQLISIPIKLITFEAPRVVTTATLEAMLEDPNSKTAKLDRSAIRISSRDDPVPGLPPYAYTRHIGKNYYIEEPIGNKVNIFASDYIHKLGPVGKALERYEGLKTDAEKNAYMPLVQGRGKVGRKKTKTSSAMMKAKMAYVRSFRRK